MLFQGVTKSLIDAQFEAEGVEGSHNREISHALGFCIGFVVGKASHQSLIVLLQK